jgi:hypothetical protein
MSEDYNLFTNPTFDDDEEGWRLTSTTHLTDYGHPASGSLNLGVDGDAAQYVELPYTGEYTLSCYIQVPGGAGGSGLSVFRKQIITADLHQSTIYTSPSVSLPLPDLGWHLVLNRIQLPARRLRFEFQNVEGPSDLRMDSAWLSYVEAGVGQEMIRELQVRRRDQALIKHPESRYETVLELAAGVAPKSIWPLQVYKTIVEENVHWYGLPVTIEEPSQVERVFLEREYDILENVGRWAAVYGENGAVYLYLDEAGSTLEDVGLVVE